VQLRTLNGIKFKNTILLYTLYKLSYLNKLLTQRSIRCRITT